MPPAMVEAAARSLCESHAQRNLPDWVMGAASPWDSPPVPPGAVAAWREGFRAQAREALAAALSVCEVREEWGYRSLWSQVTAPDPSNHHVVPGHADRERWLLHGREMAESFVAEAESVPRSLIRRLVITTPAEEADR